MKLLMVFHVAFALLHFLENDTRPRARTEQSVGRLQQRFAMRCRILFERDIEGHQKGSDIAVHAFTEFLVYPFSKGLRPPYHILFRSSHFIFD
jgi:hypothetical protein